MEKDTTIIKKLVVVAIILAVVTISILAFIGVYTKQLNKLSNIIPDYTYSTEFEGNREYKFVLATNEAEKEVYIDENGNICGEVKEEENKTESTEVELQTDENSENPEAANNNEENVEEKSNNDIEGYTKEKRTIKDNEDSVLTPDSYRKSKDIIQKRLDALQVNEYNIRLDDEKGNLVVEIPDNEDSNYIYEAMKSEGKFAIVDSKTGLELMNNSHLKNSTVGYSGENGSYTVYLQIAFNKEGKDILKDISNKYVEKEVEKEEKSDNNEDASAETTENTEENNETVVEATEETEDTTEPEKEIKYVDIMLDDSKIMTTYFGEELTGGEIQIPLNQNISQEEIQKTLKSANAISVLLNNGHMPNKYVLESDNFVKSYISEKTLSNIMISIALIVLIITVYFIIAFGLNGLIGAIINIGYLGIVSLALRYTSVIITLSAIVTIFGVISMNLIFMLKLLKEMKKNKNAKMVFFETMKNLYLSIVPVIIVAFIFTFMSNANVSGIGMILFWGILVHILYSILITRSIYVLNESKTNIEY